MNEVITFPDAEALTVQYLLTVGTGAHISSDVPDPRPDLLVTVLRAGGTRRNLISDSPMLIVQAWASTKGAAHDLCQLVRAHIHAMAGTKVNGVWAYKVTEVGGPAYLPDPDTNTPRYQITVQLHLRGTAI